MAARLREKESDEDSRIEVNISGLHKERYNAPSLESLGPGVTLPIFPCADLEKKTLIASGGRAMVQKVYLKSQPDKALVMKTIVQTTPEDKNSFAKEVKMLQALSHSNICKARGLTQDGRNWAILFDYYSFDFREVVKVEESIEVNTLYDFLRTCHQFEVVAKFEEKMKMTTSIVKDVVIGLKYLHTNDIVHRDMKPENVLVCNKYENASREKILCKLTDFGESRSRSIQTQSIKTRTNRLKRGTEPYYAPEQMLESLQQASLNDFKKIDIWALGQTLYCIFNPDVPHPYLLEFDESQDLNVFIKGCMRQQRLPRMSATYSDFHNMINQKGLIELMCKCLVFEASERPFIDCILTYTRALIHDMYPWYHGSIEHNEAEGLLRYSRNGSFLVRKREPTQGFEVLYRHDDSTKWFYVEEENDLKVVCGNNQFETLEEVILYYPRYLQHPVRERPIHATQHICSSEVVEGKDVTMRCTLSKPTWRTVWLKNNKPIERDKRYECSNDNKTYQLKVNKATKNDEGVYTFKACDVEISRASLRVKDAPLSVKQELTAKEVVEGQHATLHCVLSKPNQLVKWYKGDMLLSNDRRYETKSDGETYSLIILHTTLADKSMYRLKADNGKVDTSAFLTIKEKPSKVIKGLSEQKILEGDAATLKCYLSLSNRKVVWFKDGEQLHIQNSKKFTTKCLTTSKPLSEGYMYTLHIKQPQESDSGVYTMRAMNVETSARLTVEEPPLRDLLERKRISHTQRYVLYSHEIRTADDLKNCLEEKWSELSLPREDEEALRANDLCATTTKSEIPKDDETERFEDLTKFEWRYRSAFNEADFPDNDITYLDLYKVSVRAFLFAKSYGVCPFKENEFTLYRQKRVNPFAHDEIYIVTENMHESHLAISAYCCIPSIVFWKGSLPPVGEGQRITTSLWALTIAMYITALKSGNFHVVFNNCQSFSNAFVEELKLNSLTHLTASKQIVTGIFTFGIAPIAAKIAEKFEVAHERKHIETTDYVSHIILNVEHKCVPRLNIADTLTVYYDEKNMSLQFEFYSCMKRLRLDTGGKGHQFIPYLVASHSNLSYLHVVVKVLIKTWKFFMALLAAATSKEGNGFDLFTSNLIDFLTVESEMVKQVKYINVKDTQMSISNSSPWIFGKQKNELA